ncbi:hypothetical protein OPT61_g226 [Boeremia exigua]|uniref:Uncharacterized protein n=1 Tax=Boeremia exigua TaxID=749465 RepID=A0ACC2IUT2_9PLEO|nr:hypothetical protein OPT61_g226 [Boeremia exigua]
MPSTSLSIRDISPTVTTFSTPFNRFALLSRRKFVAVGNRATAIRLHDGRMLLLNPIQFKPRVRAKLETLGGVHLIACDLGHHIYIREYLEIWPATKSIGVPALEGKRDDVRWDLIYSDSMTRPEKEFDFTEDFETVLFEGFITYFVAWYHRPTRTMIQADLMMNLPCTEVGQQITNTSQCVLTYSQQYSTSSADQGLGSREFAKCANPHSVWFRRLIYYIATVDFALMQRDAKRVAEWDIGRIVPCHGDVIDEDGNAAWESAYE